MQWEHWWFTMPLRLRSLLRGPRVERELDEELQFHLDCKIDEGIANGLTPDEARYTALRAMEGLEQRKEEMRDMRHMHWLTDLFDDARYAMRSLRRTPGLTAFVVITLAVGIGLNAATFSMIDALILRPYPVPHADGVVTLVSTSPDDSLDSLSYREYLDIRNQTKNYDGIIADANMIATGFSADARATPRVRGGMMVSGNYFQVLGVKPQLGRVFREEEDRVPGRDAVVVLGPEFWKGEFASDPSVIGRHVRLNGKDFTVIGVAPETFTGMQIFARPDFYMPLAMAPVFSTNPQKNFFEDRDDRELTVKARLKPDATLQQARSELGVLAKYFEREYPKTNSKRGAAVHTRFEMRTRMDDINWKFGVIFAILALAVLLVACTNVAGLLLSRAQARTREIAVRLAIGAGRFRLIRLVLTESLILASLAGMAGIAVGYGGVQFFASYKIQTELPVRLPFEMDTRVLLASLAFTALSALFCGLAPALQSTRRDLVSGLKAADVELPGRKHLWGRNVLVVAQVSASLMLLTASFLMTRGFQRGINEGVGFPKDHLVMASVDPRLLQYDTAQTQQFYKLLAERIRAVPGVQSAALTQNIPLGDDNWDTTAFVPEGFEMPRDREHFNSTMDTVDEQYFDTMGIPILRGRGFLAMDKADAPRVAVINEKLANHYWPGVDAVGKRIRLDNRSGALVEIVGVARTIKYQFTGETPMDFLYLPLAQHPMARMVLMLRSSRDPGQLIKTVKDVVKILAPNMPVFDARPYEDVYRNQTVNGPAIATNLVSSMGAAGLLLAIAGLYGLVAYNVSRRTREIGIRMAIGAGQADVLRLVMRHGVVLVAVGTVAGVVMGFGVERLLNSMLFNTGGVDLLAYAVVTPAMFLVTLLAAYVPARRATRIAPTVALRYE